MKSEKENQKVVPSRRGKRGLRGQTGAPWAPGGKENWQLPSGEGLAEFALHAGFAAPALLPHGDFGVGRPGGGRGSQSEEEADALAGELR